MSALAVSIESSENTDASGNSKDAHLGLASRCPASITSNTTVHIESGPAYEHEGQHKRVSDSATQLSKPRPLPVAWYAQHWSCKG